MGICKRINPIDRHVSQRIRARRREINMSQTILAEHVGVTFQQIQKVEIANNRISAGNLWKVAMALEKPVGYFYEGL